MGVVWSPQGQNKKEKKLVFALGVTEPPPGQIGGGHPLPCGPKGATPTILYIFFFIKAQKFYFFNIK
jgi:hypothetical protein